MITDLRMPRVDGLELMRRLRETDHDLLIVVLTAHGAVDSSVEATHLGVRAYLHKPFDLREVGLAVAKVPEQHRLATEVRDRRDREATSCGRIIGVSQAMRRWFETLERVEDVDPHTVLVVGESGTGKDLIAHAIHERGPVETVR